MFASFAQWFTYRQYRAARRAGLSVRAAGSFARRARPVAPGSGPSSSLPATSADSDASRAEYRAAHGRGQGNARPVIPRDRIALPGGATVRAGAHGSIFVDCPSGPCPDREGEYRPTRPVRAFFAQRRNRPDGLPDVPLLNFELIQADAQGATIRVFGPVATLARWFDSPAHWPEWCRDVYLGARVRVAGLTSLPSLRFGVTDSGAVAPATVRQSECPRDRFARLPAGQAGKRANVRRAVAYSRLSADGRREVAPLTAPRPVVPTVDVPA